MSADLPSEAASGDRLRALVALRDFLARTLNEGASPRDVAPISRQLVDVLAQIAAAESAKPEEKGTPLDELRKRRAARVADAQSQAGS